MFSKVLDCPECNHRFNFEHDSKEFPARITCPGCGKSSDYADFSALTFCTNCSTKLKIPLDVLYDDDLVCPKCGNSVVADNVWQIDEDASTFAGGNGDNRQLYKRMLQDGEVFDKFRIIRLLGKGGMAEVYLAEHLLLKQKCAVKLMHNAAGADDPVFIKRFLREAKLTHQFDHPNIVKVFDVGSDAKHGYLFIAMEYVEGKTLLDIAKEKQLSETEIVEVLDAMLKALECLAEAKVVHRDIKPSNIMRGSDGVYKLMDLGIAKSESNHQAGEMTLTMEQSTIGTPSYASPEQCKSAHSVDIRSDIYSLGASLYHVACGKLPFEGTTAVETIIKVMNNEPEPLKKFRPDLSKNLLQLIEQMMSKEPCDRPASPAVLREQLTSGKGLGRAGKFFRSVRRWFRNWLPTESCTGKKYLMRLSLRLGGTLLAALLVFNAYWFLNKNVQKVAPAATKTVKAEKKPAVKKAAAVKKVKAKLPQLPTDTSSWKKSPWGSKWFTTYDEAIKAAQKANKPVFVIATAEKENGRVVEFTASYVRRALDTPAILKEENLILLYIDCYDTADIPPEQRDYNLQLRKYITAGNGFMLPGRGVFVMLYPDGKAVEKPYSMAFDYNKNMQTFKATYQKAMSNLQAAAKAVPEQAAAAQAIPAEKVDISKLFSNFDKALSAAKAVSGRMLIVADASAAANAGAKQIFNQCGKDIVKVYLNTSDAENDRFARQFGIADAEKPLVLLINNNEDLITSCRAAEPAEVKKHLDMAYEQYRKFRAMNTGTQRTIDRRLAEVELHLQMLKNQLTTELQQKRIKFAEEQIRELKNQQAIRRKVIEASKKEYSARDTEFFREAVQKSLDRYPSVGGLGRIQNDRKILNLMRPEGVDPNVKVKTYYSLGREVALCDTIFVRGLAISTSRIFLDLLLKKYVDVNLTTSVFHDADAIDLVMFGKEEVDDNNDRNFISAIAGARAKGNQLTVGEKHNFRNLFRFMLLNPKLDVPVINTRFDSMPKDQRNFMHVAAIANSPELVEKLVLAGFSGGRNADAYGMTPWQHALRRGSAKALSMLEKYGLKTADTPQDRLYFRFFNALHNKDHAAVKECLQQGADPYATNFHKLTALQAACDNNDEQMVKLLLENKVDVNRNSPLAFPQLNHPLQIAIQHSNERIFKLLLEYGGDANFSRCFSHLKGLTTLPGFIATCAAFAPDSKPLINMLKILLERDANIFDEKNGPFALACQAANSNENPAVPRELIKFMLTCKGVDPNEKIRNRPLWNFIRDPQTRAMVKNAANK